MPLTCWFKSPAPVPEDFAAAVRKQWEGPMMEALTHPGKIESYAKIKEVKKYGVELIPEDQPEARKMAKRLDEEGVFVNPVVSPARKVPCSKPHNAVTTSVGQVRGSVVDPWGPKAESVVAASGVKCDARGFSSQAALDLPMSRPLRVEGDWYVPSKAQWAKGQRWTRCDTIVPNRSTLENLPTDFHRWAADVPASSRCYDGDPAAKPQVSRGPSTRYGTAIAMKRGSGRRRSSRSNGSDLTASLVAASSIVASMMARRTGGGCRQYVPPRRRYRRSLDTKRRQTGGVEGTMRERLSSSASSLRTVEGETSSSIRSRSVREPTGSPVAR